MGAVDGGVQLFVKPVGSEACTTGGFDMPFDMPRLRETLTGGHAICVGAGVPVPCPRCRLTC